MELGLRSHLSYVPECILVGFFVIFFSIAGVARAQVMSEILIMVDHFLGYSVVVESRRLRGPLEVSLADQFDEAGFNVIRRPREFFNPVDKNGEGITDPDTHLAGYLIRRSPPISQVITGVVVENQFGTLTVDLSDPTLLLVPSFKDPDNPVPVPDPESHNVDHFKCYAAVVSAETPPFEPLQVPLKDQFEDKLYEVLKPVEFCNPVDRNAEGIKNDANHLMCYLARPAPGEPQHEPVSGIHVSNQFDSLRLRTSTDKKLCVPSQKISAGDGD